MTEKGELLNDAEVEFLLASGEEGTATPAAPPPSHEGQTVTMRGDLEQINLADIFQTLGMSKMEGVLRVRNPLEERQIYCRDGHVRILVPARLATRRLGQRLVNAGLLQVDQLRQVLVAQRKEKLPIGQMLMQTGLVTQDQIDEIVGMQVGEDLFALFTWRHGQFEFFKGPIVDDDLRASFEACPEFEVNSLLLEVARRSDEWQSILEALASLDEIPNRIADPAEDSELNEAHRGLLGTADGRQTYRDLADHTTLGLFEVARAARDLVTGGLLANIADHEMVAAANMQADAGNTKKAVLLLQTLRDRPGDRSLGVLRGMAEALEKASERRLAGNLLLEAAQRQSDPETALELARRARELSPYDAGTLSFLRTILLAHSAPDSPELEKTTLELLDALIDGDLVPTALEICADARMTGTLRPQILLRETRARQKGRDPQGAADVLFELGQLYDAEGDKKHALEAYEALLRLDRTRKDVAKLVHQRKQTKVGRIVRATAIAAASLMLGGMGLVLWQQHALNRAVAEADREVTSLLGNGDRSAARQRWEHWRQEIGENEAIEDLRNRIAFAEAAEQARLQKAFRTRVNERLTQAAQELGRGEFTQAIAAYAGLWNEKQVRTEVVDVVTSRLDVLLTDLEGVGKSLPNRLPPQPDTLFDRKALTTHLADLQAACTPVQLRTFQELQTQLAGDGLPAFLSPEQVARARTLVQASAPTFQRAAELAQAYTEALQRNEQQRRLDPMFKAAVEREAAYDFVAALSLYRELEKQPTGDNDLRAHFRDQVARNATIVKLLEALHTATMAGDFATAQQHLRALRTAFPEVPFDRLVQLPLRIDSCPRGAKITCNGNEVGATPITLTRAPGDETRFVVAMPGFQPLTALVRGDDVGSWNGTLLLLPDQAWKHGAEVDVPPAQLANGDLIVVDRSGSVTRVTPTGGKPVWTFRSGDLSGLLSRPLVDGDYVLVTSLDGDLRALSLADGTLAWSLPQLPTEVAPTHVEHTLLLATTDQRLCAVDLGRREVTAVALPEPVHGSPLVSGSTVVVVGERGTLAAFSLPGLRPAWRQATRDLGTTTAAIGRGRVFVAGEQGTVLAFDLTNGQQLWQQALQVEAHGITAAGDRGPVLSAARRQFHLDGTTGEPLRTFAATDGEWARGATVVGERLLVPLRDGGIDVFDLASGARLYRLESQKRARALPCAAGALVPTNDRTLHWFASFR